MVYKHHQKIPLLVVYGLPGRALRGGHGEEGEYLMEYRIEYADRRCYSFAKSRKDLIEWLKLLKDETISDIRKLYKSGASDSVLEKYARYIGGNR